MTDKRLELAVAYRAAGLFEKADALLAEIVREKTGVRSDLHEISSELGDKLNGVRALLGMRPRRHRAKNPHPTVQDRLEALLADVGVTEIESWKISKGYWLRSEADVMRWECQARRWQGESRGGPGWHVGCWTSMSDCVRYGITAGLDGAGYCDIAVDAKPKHGPRTSAHG